MRGGFLLEDGRVAEDAVADAAELVVYGLVDGLAVAVSGQCFSEFAPFETEFADFIGQIAAFGERLFDDAELVDEPSGQDEQALGFDQSEYSGCAWKIPSGYSSLIALLRKMRLIS